VVTHDPRGISGSPLDDPEQDSTPELRADDVAVLLDALGAESADVFGSSGGAVTGRRNLLPRRDSGSDDEAHELRGTISYLPDVAALTAGSTRVLVGLGVDSGALVTHRTSLALANLLGRPPVEFPGDHGGFMATPKEFAEVLRKTLSGVPA
jgi:hypothetical protein